MKLPNPVDFAIPFFVLLVLAEMVVAWAKDRRRYCPRDTLTSLALGLGSTVAGLLTGGAVYALAMWVWQFRLFEIGWQWYWFVAAFVIDDLAYYVFHRTAHRVRWFWATHAVHHSANELHARACHAGGVKLAAVGERSVAEDHVFPGVSEA